MPQASKHGEEEVVGRLFLDRLNIFASDAIDVAESARTPSLILTTSNGYTLTPVYILV